jgi:hypothetical protein
MDPDNTSRVSRLMSGRPRIGVNNAVMTHMLAHPHSLFPSSHTTDRPSAMVKIKKKATSDALLKPLVKKLSARQFRTR